MIITSGYTEARIITSELNSLTEQDTVKVSEQLVGKQLYSAFQLLCITICITTKETNFKVQALHESSMPPVKGQRYGNLFALQSTNYESVVIASDINHCFL